MSMVLFSLNFPNPFLSMMSLAPYAFPAVIFHKMATNAGPPDLGSKVRIMKSFVYEHFQ